MDRKTQERYRRILSLAQMHVLTGKFRPSIHSTERGAQREIMLGEAEAATLDPDARVVGTRSFHPEGETFRIAGRRADGLPIEVVVAFDNNDPEKAVELRVVTVMYPDEV